MLEQSKHYTIRFFDPSKRVDACLQQLFDSIKNQISGEIAFTLINKYNFTTKEASIAVGLNPKTSQRYIPKKGGENK